MDWLSGIDYKVALLSSNYSTAKVIVLESLKSQGLF